MEFVQNKKNVYPANLFYELKVGCKAVYISSWKHLCMKANPGLHLAYSKSGGESGVGMKL